MRTPEKGENFKCFLGFFKVIQRTVWMLFFLLPLISHSNVLAQSEKEVTTYEQLIKAIRETRRESKARIQKAAAQEKVRESWEIGKLIDEHVLLHKERADYADYTLLRLSKDLEISETELRYMLQFARVYPIHPAPDELSWAHYRELLSLNDDTEREEVAQKAKREKLSSKEVREEVRKRKAAKIAKAKGTGSSEPVPFANEPVKLPKITPGPVHTYPIIRLKDRLKIDLGFGIYRDVPAEYAGQFEEGDVVTIESNQLRKVAEGYDTLRDVPVDPSMQPLETSGNSKATSRNFDNYTYTALVTSVVDGDTFHALIDLGLGTTMAQRVRLRRVDAPELPTAEGEEAKALLQEILARDHGRVVIQSRELDQHGRPIADTWVLGKSVDQELVDQGLAVVMKE